MHAITRIKIAYDALRCFQRCAIDSTLCCVIASCNLDTTFQRSVVLAGYDQVSTRCCDGPEEAE
jgi:hypothetical protein